MLDVLNVVKGAVADKELIPALTHVHFYEGRVQGGNGKLSIDAPCDGAHDDITVPTVPLINALRACGESPDISITDAGKLRIKNGKFRALLPLLDNKAYPASTLEGKVLTRDKTEIANFLTACNTLRAFVGNDASRPWCNGIIFEGDRAYATNNVILASVPCPMHGAKFNIPSYAVDEVLRLVGTHNYNISEVLLSDNAVSVAFMNGTWLRSNLFNDEWPDLDHILAAYDYSDLPVVPAGVADAVDTTKHFVEDKKMPTVYFTGDSVNTGEGDVQAVFECSTDSEAAFRVEPLSQVLAAATNMDLSKHPKPVPFSNPETGLTGVLVGVVAR